MNLRLQTAETIWAIISFSSKPMCNGGNTINTVLKDNTIVIPEHKL
jgi:hypothetical protein